MWYCKVDASLWVVDGGGSVMDMSGKVCCRGWDVCSGPLESGRFVAGLWSGTWNRGRNPWLVLLVGGFWTSRG